MRHHQVALQSARRLCEARSCDQGPWNCQRVARWVHIILTQMHAAVNTNKASRFKRWTGGPTTVFLCIEARQILSVEVDLMGRRKGADPGDRPHSPLPQRRGTPSHNKKSLGCHPLSPTFCAGSSQHIRRQVHLFDSRRRASSERFASVAMRFATRTRPLATRLAGTGLTGQGERRACCAFSFNVGPRRCSPSAGGIWERRRFRSRAALTLQGAAQTKEVTHRSFATASNCLV